MKLIDKDAVVAEIERHLALVEKRLSKNNSYSHSGKIAWERDKALYDRYEFFLSFLNTLEVKEVNEVPATVMVNKYGNRFISSWSGLKEYDDLKEGQEIKILIPKK